METEKEQQLPTIKRNIRYANLRQSSSELTIKTVSLPENGNFDEKLAWICASLGFFEKIDKEKNAAIIFKEIYLAGMQGQVLTSTIIAERIGMSRGSVINHLNNLKKAGLIEKGGKYYFTRHKTMEGIITEIEDDITHNFSRMKKIAKEIDSEIDDTIRI